MTVDCSFYLGSYIAVLFLCRVLRTFCILLYEFWMSTFLCYYYFHIRLDKGLNVKCNDVFYVSTFPLHNIKGNLVWLLMKQLYISNRVQMKWMFAIWLILLIENIFFSSMWFYFLLPCGQVGCIIKAVIVLLPFEQPVSDIYR